MDYIPVLVLIVMGVIISSAILAISVLLGPKNPNKMKDEPFECGVPPMGDARHRMSVRFYLVAILFLLFDVEAIFFFPFAISFKEFLAFGPFILLEVGVFVAILLAGYIYVLRRGALEWD